jgi:glycosyltransferase involved in cell wall biosynthesis
VESWPARKNAQHNPFQSLMSDALERSGWEVREFSPLRSVLRNADVWHWHWPDGHFAHTGRWGARTRGLELRALLVFARLRGTSVVWTAHNLGNHEGRNANVEARFMRYFHRSIAGVHFLSHATRSEAYRQYPALAGIPSCVIPHGHYRATVRTMTKEVARAELGLDGAGAVLAFVGKIRRYKGVGLLVEAFDRMPDPLSHLIVAGAVGDDSSAYLRRKSDANPQISLFLQHLNERELSLMVSAADFAVFPYTKVANSGSALLALSLDRPILVPALGTFLELKEEVGERWVYCYEPPLSTDTLVAAIHHFSSNDMLRPNLEEFDWDRIGARLAAWFTDVVDG